MIEADLTSVEGNISSDLTESKLLPAEGDNSNSVEREETMNRLHNVYREDFGRQRRRMETHFDELVNCYYDKRVAGLQFPDDGGGGSGQPQLDRFTQCLSKYTRYHSLVPLASLSYTSDLFSGASIVSSIEFDRFV